MVLASDIREGTVLQLDKTLFKVESARLHKGGGKTGPIIHLTLRNLLTHHTAERRFRPTEKLEDVSLQRVTVEYLYQDGDLYYFMDVNTYEQFGIPESVLGARHRFLQPNIRMVVEIFNENPVDVIFPETVEIKVASTGPGVHEAESTYKPATLDNGLEILVPQFIKTGDTIKIDTRAGKYVERVKA